MYLLQTFNKIHIQLAVLLFLSGRSLLGLLLVVFLFIDIIHIQKGAYRIDPMRQITALMGPETHNETHILGVTAILTSIILHICNKYIKKHGI